MFNQNFDERIKGLQKMQEKAAKEAVRLNKLALRKWQDLDVISPLKRLDVPEFTLTPQKPTIAKRLRRHKGKICFGIILSLMGSAVAFYFYKKKNMEQAWEEDASDCYEFINDKVNDIKEKVSDKVTDIEEAGMDALEDVLEKLDETRANDSVEK